MDFYPGPKAVFRPDGSGDFGLGQIGCFKVGKGRIGPGGRRIPYQQDPEFIFPQGITGYNRFYLLAEPENVLMGNKKTPV